MAEVIQIQQDDVTLTDLYKKRDEQIKILEKNPEDFTAKHLLETYKDEIRIKRQQLIEKEKTM